jgi:ankyrin repeat protein
VVVSFNTALHYACLTGNTCAIKLLINANAEIDVSNKKVISTKFNDCLNKNVTINTLMGYYVSSATS